MSNNSTSLAVRRAQLIEQCRTQRCDLAEELGALRAPFSLGQLRERISGSNKLALAAAAAALGLALARPRRLLGLVSRGTALFGVARRVLPLLMR